MKKITNIYQLKAEKEWIRQHQEELEEKIRLQWNELKGSFKPGQLAKNAYGRMVEEKVESNLHEQSVLKNTIIYAGTMWAKKLADKAKDKIDKLFSTKAGSVDAH